MRNGNLRAEIEVEVLEDINGVIFAMAGYAGGDSLFAVNGTLYQEYSALLVKRDTVEVGRRPAGKVSIAMERCTSMERTAPAELMFWINGEPARGGTVRRTASRQRPVQVLRVARSRQRPRDRADQKSSSTVCFLGLRTALGNTAS